MKVSDIKVCLENVEIVLSDLRKERDSITAIINENILKVNESEKYLNSISEKEDDDARFFTPRNVENRFKSQIEDSENIISSLSSYNIELYSKRNMIDEHISRLKDTASILSKSIKN